MATTPVYNWPTPDDTDLVKDGAKAIRDLGNAIDTTVSSVPTGLVHIKTESFTSVSSIELTSVFSSTYKNYKIVFNIKGSSNGAIQGRFGTTGSPDSSSNYFYSLWLTRTDNNNTVSAGTGPITNFYLSEADSTTNSNSVGEVLVGNPNVASWTITRTQSFGQIFSVSVGGRLQTTTQYTSFFVLPAAGTITGTIQVFGFKE
jgi:hypothetical protein